MQRHRVIRARPTVARARKHDHPLTLGSDSEVIVDSEIRNAKNREQIRQAAVVLEFRTCLPTPGVGFLFNPPPGIQPQPSNAAEMEAPLWRVASRRVNTSACLITRSKTDPLCRKGTGPVRRRCANSTFGVLASPRLRDPRVVPRTNCGCEYAHHLETI